SAATVHATVAYCPPGEVWMREVLLDPGATLLDAVRASGVLQAFPALAENALDLGVFNRPRSAQDPLRDGDRIEIYRPLTIDPKEARRIRADVRRRRKGS
ncbi:MAG TPA: RnfH family protein, partial [Burkholderiaceae bacterium]|nr:RnfH family protein [Burkholderiaceae bacterium]